MGKRKFIERIQEAFGFKSDTTSKSEAIKDLVQKLKVKQSELKLELKLTEDEAIKKDLKESIEILKKQIKKGGKLLEE